MSFRTAHGQGRYVRDLLQRPVPGRLRQKLPRREDDPGHAHQALPLDTEAERGLLHRRDVHARHPLSGALPPTQHRRPAPFPGEPGQEADWRSQARRTLWARRRSSVSKASDTAFSQMSAVWMAYSKSAERVADTDLPLRSVRAAMPALHRLPHLGRRRRMTPMSGVVRRFKKWRNGERPLLRRRDPWEEACCPHGLPVSQPCGSHTTARRRGQRRIACEIVHRGQDALPSGPLENGVGARSVVKATPAAARGPPECRRSDAVGKAEGTRSAGLRRGSRTVLASGPNARA